MEFLFCMTAAPVLQVADAAGWDTLNTVSLGTQDGDVHSYTTGSEEAACTAPRSGKNADNCSIV
jgi:hypothetical protein